MSFRFRLPIRLRHTDAAGVLFFAEQLVLVHETYEAFMDAQGFSIREILQKRDYALPILHAETDFRQPLRVGDEVEIELLAERIGDTSFTLKHRVHHESRIVGQGKTVHACIDPKSGQKTPLPEALVRALQNQLASREDDSV